MATMIDILQAFEIEIKGAIIDTVHIPMFERKLRLGHTVIDDEQDILDASQPKDIDAQSFFTMINRLHRARKLPAVHLQPATPSAGTAADRVADDGRARVGCVRRCVLRARASTSASPPSRQ